MSEKITRIDLDNLADIIWWIKGHVAADAIGCPFKIDHVESLRKARINLEEMMNETNQN